MDRLFVDAVFWMALLRPRDQHHDRAVAWQRYLSRRATSLVTTDAVWWEVLNALAHHSTRGRVWEVYSRARIDRKLQMFGFDPDLTSEATELYGTRIDKDWSLTDCLSFVVMGRAGLSAALTTDHHFEQAGFEALLLREPPSA